MCSPQPLPAIVKSLEQHYLDLIFSHRHHAETLPQGALVAVLEPEPRPPDTQLTTDTLTTV